LIAARGAACRARCSSGGRGVHLPGCHPGGWADVPRSGLPAAANRTIASCRRPRGRSCAAVVRSAPLLSKIAGRADDKRRMRGLRGRRAHIVEHVSIGREHVPADGTRVHPAGTLPDIREHRAPGGVTHPAKARPPAGHLKARRTAPAPKNRRRSRTRRRSRRNPPHLSKICDAGGRPVSGTATGPAKTPSRERGLPEGRQ